MKTYIKIIALMLTLLIFSCSKNRDEAPGRGNAEPPITRPSEPNEADTVRVERKLIKEGQVEFETNDMGSTRDLIFESIEKNKGYASSDKENKSRGRISNTIIIRVPAANFDNLVSDATKGVQSFDRKSIEVKDVTEEFLDIQARLKTKRELESRYLELLVKAVNVTEILEIKKQAGLLRSDIESIEGRLKYLENKVSLSTLTISFYQPLSNEIQFANKLKQGVKSGWENLIWSFVFLTHIWPFLLIFFGLIFGLRMWLKKRTAKA